MSDFLFIIGVGRSGTTLLQGMLNAHSKINIPPETHFVKKYVLPELRNIGSKDKVQAIAERMLKDPNFDLDDQEIGSLTFNSADMPGLVIPSLYVKIFNPDSKFRYLGDKDPMNSNYLKFIKMAFPDAMIIHIIRDPRDVVSSRLKSGWGSNRSLAWHAAEYEFSLNKARKEGKLYFHEQYMEVRYEDLILSPEREMNNICSFLELPFEPVMMQHHLGADKIIRKDELQWKENVLKPIDSKNIGKWKKDLDKRKGAVLQNLMTHTLKSLNYDLFEEIEHFSLLEKVRFQIFQFIFRLRYSIGKV